MGISVYVIAQILLEGVGQKHFNKYGTLGNILGNKKKLGILEFFPYMSVWSNRETRMGSDLDHTAPETCLLKIFPIGDAWAAAIIHLTRAELLLLHSIKLCTI